MNNYFLQNNINNEILIFVKYLGDNEITLEYNKNKKEANKFVNDYRRKVEVDLDKEDYQFLSELV